MRNSERLSFVENALNLARLCSENWVETRGFLIFGSSLPKGLGRRTLIRMSYKGQVKNGVVVLPPGAVLKEGAEVEVTPVISEKDAEDFTDALLRIAARTKNLPSDLARNHDYYLHGLPKK
jgi:hypothetical protein